MLSNLDNEVIFKKAFTNKIVFTKFVKDIIGIDIKVDKIETEKKFDQKAGYIDMKFDIFAESIDKRVIVEIQRVEYDHNFDRFMHYFLSAITEQQKNIRTAARTALHPRCASAPDQCRPQRSRQRLLPRTFVRLRFLF